MTPLWGIYSNERVGVLSPNLNTAGYINVYLEKEEFEVANIGLQINLADQTRLLLTASSKFFLVKGFVFCALKLHQCRFATHQTPFSDQSL